MLFLAKRNASISLIPSLFLISNFIQLLTETRYVFFMLEVSPQLTDFGGFRQFVMNCRLNSVRVRVNSKDLDSS